MLELSFGARNRSAEPALRMAKIGTGLTLACLEPSYSGLYSAPRPTVAVQPPEGEGSPGSSKGGAGRVNAVCADTGTIETAKAAITTTAASGRVRRISSAAASRSSSRPSKFKTAPSPDPDLH